MFQRDDSEHVEASMALVGKQGFSFSFLCVFVHTLLTMSFSTFLCVCV